MKILYTGGSGQFAEELKKLEGAEVIHFATRLECNLIRRESIKAFAQEHKYFDVVVTGANIYPGTMEGYNLASFLVPMNHIYLIEQFEKLPKYFINLTTGLKQFDEHYLYRAQKTFAEDLFNRYFKYNKSADVNYFNLMPHHLDDPDTRKISAELFLDMLQNINDYNDTEYVLDVTNKRVKSEKW